MVHPQGKLLTASTLRVTVSSLRNCQLTVSCSATAAYSCDNLTAFSRYFCHPDEVEVPPKRASSALPTRSRLASSSISRSTLLSAHYPRLIKGEPGFGRWDALPPVHIVAPSNVVLLLHLLAHHANFMFLHSKSAVRPKLSVFTVQTANSLQQAYYLLKFLHLSTR